MALDGRPGDWLPHGFDVLAQRNGSLGNRLFGAFEDTWYYLWRERRLPVNVDPFDSKLDDEMERARLRRVFEQKLDTAVGYVLPIKAQEQPGTLAPRWSTGPWFLRDERMYLMPGDSPMGYRLPLDSQPWAAIALVRCAGARAAHVRLLRCRRAFRRRLKWCRGRAAGARRSC